MIDLTKAITSLDLIQAASTLIYFEHYEATCITAAAAAAAAIQTTNKTKILPASLLLIKCYCCILARMSCHTLHWTCA